MPFLIHRTDNLKFKYKKVYFILKSALKEKAVIIDLQS